MPNASSRSAASRLAWSQLKSERIAVLPSLLQCDFGRLADEVSALEAAGAKGLHLDVMDGHFVPNMTYGLTILEAVRRLTKLPLDVHLMISNPADYVQRYCEAGADLVTIHAEATKEVRPLLESIRASGAGAGLAINPPTPVGVIEDCLDACDMVLVMSVMPGFGGQKFDSTALQKLQELREKCSPEMRLEVDGGVNDDTIGECAAAGATMFVTGSAIFAHRDYAGRIRSLEALAAASARN